MSQSNSATDHFGWKVFRVSPKEFQDNFLAELDLEKNLPLVTWQGQVGMLDGAPDAIIIQYLPLLHWKAQVAVYDKYLSVQSMPQAVPFLKDEAKHSLKIQVKNVKTLMPLQRRWRK